MAVGCSILRRRAPIGSVALVLAIGIGADVAHHAVAAAGQVRSTVTVPFLPSAADELREGVVRVINHSDEAGTVRIVAFDDDGNRYGPLSVSIQGRRTIHLNSQDIESGNPDVGLSGGTGSGSGDWRLVLSSELDVEALAYARTADGLLTAIHDVVVAEGDLHRVATFNPASNTRQVSLLRVVNPNDEDVEAVVAGIDDRGERSAQAVTITVPAAGAQTLSSPELEQGSAATEGALGDGAGKWQLLVESRHPLEVMNLLESPTGHLVNLSTGQGARRALRAQVEDSPHIVPFFPAAAGGLQGFVRIINHSKEAGEVRIAAFDDSDWNYDPITLSVGAEQTTHFNSRDLEHGNPSKGLSHGLGRGVSDWWLRLTTDVAIEVLVYVRTVDGFLAAMHDTAPSIGNRHRIAAFNPASDGSLDSRLRLVNTGNRDAEVTVSGNDDRGLPAGKAVFVLPAGLSRTLSARELEQGGESLDGALGDGAGRWQLDINSDQPVVAMSLVSNTARHVANLSTAPGRGAGETAAEVYRVLVYDQVLRSKCLNCHVADGAAGDTPLVLFGDSDNNHEGKNLKAFRDYLDNVSDAALILDKIQGTGHDGGVQLATNTTDYESMERFLALVADATIQLEGTTGNDVVNGTNGNDILNGLAGNDTLNGGSGDDVLDGGDGDDILNGGDGLDTLNGGDGTDTLNGGLGADTLNGGNGGDTLNGGAGDDTLNGGAGDDALNGGEGIDVLVGGEGADALSGDAWDTVDYSQSNDGVTIDFWSGVALGRGGHAEGDSLIGTFGTIIGSSYDDTLSGPSNLYGGGGDDRLEGRDGDETIDGGDGNDRLYGNGGHDWLIGGEGDDELVGGDGNDVLDAGDGTNTLDGGTGDDRLTAGSGDDELAGGDGNDVLDAGDGTNTLDGGTGNDKLTAGSGDDELAGGEGNDWLEGGEGDDTLDGGEGEDWLRGGPGEDALENGGVDYADSDAAIVVDLSTGTASGGHAEGDSFVNVHDVVGSEFDDRIVGTERDNELFAGGGDDNLVGGDGNDRLEGGEGDDALDGGDGNDSLYGQDGDDTLTGSAGDDVVDGGSGDDTLDYSRSDSAILVSLVPEGYWNYQTRYYETIPVAEGSGGHADGDQIRAVERIWGSVYDDEVAAAPDCCVLPFWFWGDQGDDQLRGGHGNDTLSGGPGNDALHGQGGSDVINGGAGDDHVVGGAGDDSLNGGEGDDTLFGGAGNDSLNGGPGDDTLDGGHGKDSLLGEAGNDTLDGGQHYDVLNGGTGNDRLFAREGNDALRGGEGEDAFLIDLTAPNQQIDINIVDFDSANDLIHVAAHESLDFSEYAVTVTDRGTEVEILGSVLRLAGIQGVGQSDFETAGIVYSPFWNFLSDERHSILSVRFGDLDDDGDFDLAHTTDRIVFYENVGSPAVPEFVEQPDWGTLDIVHGGDRLSQLVDVDDDGDLDAIIGFEGPYNGNRGHYINNGDNSVPEFASELTRFDDARRRVTRFYDWDGDGDLDGVGDDGYYITLLRNDGEAGWVVVRALDQNESWVFRRFVRHVGDWDMDGNVEVVLDSGYYHINSPNVVYEGSWLSRIPIDPVSGVGNPDWMSFADLDDDDDSDLLLLDTESHGYGEGRWLRYFVNRGGRLEEANFAIGWCERGEPELVVESPTVSNGRSSTGGAFSLSATIRNNGDGCSTSTTLRYYRSTDAMITTSDAEVGSDEIPRLAASGSTVKSVALSAPGDHGTYHYGACVDTVADESDTDNNCSAGVALEVFRAPDLVVESLAVSDDTPSPGVPITLSATVRNNGDAVAASTTLRFYRSTDPLVTKRDTEVASETTEGLDATATSDHTVSLTAPSDTGTYHYGACVDAVEDESDTDNNCSEGVAVVVAPSAEFSAQRVISDAADRAVSVHASDLDGDGDHDVLSASFGDSKVAWYENLGGGEFSAQRVISDAAASAESVHASDLDGDGDHDVLFASSFGDNKVAWYENLGGGEFSVERVISDAADRTYSVHTSDLDGDGDPDVLSASQGSFGKVAWYENLGDGEFSAQRVISDAVYGAFSVHASDLDGDGDPDVLSGGVRDRDVAWYENLGGGEFSAIRLISDEADGAHSVYASDLDGDGDPDVLSASSGDHKVAWYENLGGGEFSGQRVISSAAAGARSVHASDLDGDGDPDVLSASAGDHKVAWYENLGGGEFSAQRVISDEADGAISVHAADLDGDGDADVLSASQYDNKVAWYENL